MKKPQRIDQQLTAAPLTIGGKVIQPVARLEGWWLSGEGGVGAWLRLSPASLTVQEGEQRYEVPFTDPEQGVIRILVLVGGAVAGLSLLIMLLTTYLTRRR